MSKFNLKAYSIADLDEIEKGKSTAQVLAYKKTDPQKWSDIQKRIKQKYADNFFIFKEGDLEDYLGIVKGLDKVIEFCEKQFTNWLIDLKFQHLKSEIDGILSRIFRTT